MDDTVKWIQWIEIMKIPTSKAESHMSMTKSTTSTSTIPKFSTSPTISDNCYKFGNQYHHPCSYCNQYNEHFYTKYDIIL